VAAVSYWHSVDEFNLLWAKFPVNNTSSQLALQYIEELLQKAKDGVKTKELLNIVIPMCKEKIFHRVKKLAKSFGVSLTNQREEDFNLWGFDGKLRSRIGRHQATAKRHKSMTGGSSISYYSRFHRWQVNLHMPLSFFFGRSPYVWMLLQL
jgi:hypothetical protein